MALVNNGQGTITQNDIIYSTIFIGVFTTLCTIISITLILQLKYKTFRMDPLSKCLFVCCVLSSTLCEWADLSRHIICYFFYNNNVYFYPLNNIYGCADCFYYFGAISFYLIATYRLQRSFTGTSYSLNCCVLAFFYTLIALAFIVAIFFVVIVFIIPKNDKATKNYYFSFFVHYDTIPLILMSIIDLILNTSLLILFISKLKQLLSGRLINCDIFALKDSNNYLYDSSVKLSLLITRHAYNLI
eukprot:163574_1